MKPKFMADGRCTCGHPPQPDILEPGYGMRKDGNTYCIDCLTIEQKAKLERDGTGKLIVDGDTVRNEAGTLRFPIIHSSWNSHNIAQKRRDVWFIGPDDMRWQGTRFGETAGPANVRRCAGLHQLREQVQQLGMSLYLRDGEYRLNFRHGRDTTAYYSNDPVDVYRQAKIMAAERDAPKPIAMDW